MISKDCFNIMKRLFNGELSQKQYYEGLMALHTKYPMSGHNPPLTDYQIKNYRNIPIIIKDNKIRYLDHLQPFSFKEAAQMYYWHTIDKQARKEAI